MPGQHNPATIDVLVPTYTSRARKSVEVGRLVTTEVPGLATALRYPAVSVRLSMRRLNGDELTAMIHLPNEASSLMLKALAYEHRGSGKDAVDVWRCLEILHQSKVNVATESADDFARARKIIEDGLRDLTNPMMSAIATQRNLSKPAARQLHTRLKALTKAALGDTAP